MVLALLSAVPSLDPERALDMDAIYAFSLLGAKANRRPAAGKPTGDERRADGSIARHVSSVSQITGILNRGVR